MPARPPSDDRTETRELKLYVCRRFDDPTPEASIMRETMLAVGSRDVQSTKCERCGELVMFHRSNYREAAAASHALLYPVCLPCADSIHTEANRGYYH
jgi:formylmethanofuran dehydrogenase subunit E